MRDYIVELDAPLARPLDAIVRVSCTARPDYPSWTGRVMHTDLQNTGPSRYDLRTDVTPWRHDSQKRGFIRGNAVYEYLETRNEIDSCLGRVDCVEIKKMGAPIFRAVFGDKALLFFLRSTIASQSGILEAPCLFIFNNEVMDRWFWLGGYWPTNYFTLRFN